MTKRVVVSLICVAALLLCGIAAMRSAAFESAEIFDTAESFETNEEDVVDLYEDPDSYDTSDNSDAATIIIEENLEKTRAANNVAAVVFDFRGFDTLGESFILLTAIAGSFVILSRKKDPHGGAHGEGGDQE